MVGGLEHGCYFPSYAGDVILPIDFHIFQEWLWHHQPGVILSINWAISLTYNWYFGSKQPPLSWGISHKKGFLAGGPARNSQ